MRKKPVKKWKICSRGHRFQKSSDCPVYPICWSGYYRTRKQSDFPESLAAPALRALLSAKITKLQQLAKRTEDEIADLHGMGPKAIGQLKSALRKRNLSFAQTERDRRHRTAPSGMRRPSKGH
jgi:hypothetical protein